MTSSQKALDRWLKAMLHYGYNDTSFDRGYKEALLSVQRAVEQFRELDNFKARKPRIVTKA